MTRRPGATAGIIASERMVKERQMRWTPRGALVLIQVRTHFLNDQLTVDFRRWYAGLTRYWIQRRSRRSLRFIPLSHDCRGVPASAEVGDVSRMR